MGHRVKGEPRCPNCGNLADGATAYDGSEAAPSPGNYLVCLYCSSIGMYNEDYSIKQLAEQDLVQLEQEDPMLVVELRKAQVAVQKIMQEKRRKYN